MFAVLESESIMDKAIDEKQPWNCKGLQFDAQKPQKAEKTPIKLPKLVLWECESVKVSSLSPQKKVFFKRHGRHFLGHFFRLLDMAGLPEW